MFNYKKSRKVLVLTAAFTAFVTAEEVMVAPLIA